MAWGNQAKRDYVTVNESFAVCPTEDGNDSAKMELSRCVQDGELYLRFFPPKNEHGKAGKPVSMSLANWERQMAWAEFISETCDKARQTEGAIKLREINKARAEDEFKKLNESRSAYPDLFSDDVYAKKADAIKAKYPDVYPVQRKPAPVEVEVEDQT